MPLLVTTKITQSLLVIYLFIIFKKKRYRKGLRKWGNYYQRIDFHVEVASKFDPSATPNKKQRKIGKELRLSKIVVDLT